MIINSKKIFKESKFFTLGEKVLVRGEDYVPVDKAGHIDEDEIVYIDYSRYEQRMAVFNPSPKDGILYSGAPASGKTQALLLKMKEEVLKVINRLSFLDCFIIPEIDNLFIFTAFTRTAVDSLPVVFRKMNCLSKSFLNDIDSVPQEWVGRYKRFDTSDWVKFLWGRAKFYKNVYEDYSRFKSPLHFRMFLLPIIVDSIRNIDKISIPNEKQVSLFVDEASFAPAFLFSQLLNRSSQVFGAATEGIKLEDPFLPPQFKLTVADVIKTKTVLPKVELEVEEKIIKSDEEEKITKELLKKYNSVVFISDGTVYPAYEHIIRKTVVTASSGPQYDVVIYKKGKSIKKNPELEPVHREIAKSKATELFVEVV